MKPYWSNEQRGLTIYCGDCLTIMPQLCREFDLVFTDPPYGHNNNNNGDLIARWEAALGGVPADPNTEWRPIANDGPEANDLFRAALPLLRDRLQPGCCCCCCCCGGGGPDPQFARWSLWLDEVFNFKQMVVWDKGPMGMGWHYRRSYEVVLVGTVPGAACRWYDKTKQVENILRAGEVPKVIPSKEQHPTEKSWMLAAHFTRLHTRGGDTVLDPFLGSGTTLVACYRLGRQGVGIEISEEYCELAATRLDREIAQGRLFEPAETAPKPVQATLEVEL